MTVGVIALDGLDWNMVERTRALSTLPGDPWTAELNNDLPGHPDHGEYSLFTPHVWTCIFSGEIQQAIWGWHEPDGWADLCDDAGLTFLWDKVPGASVANLKVHGHYLNKNSPLPDGWTPVHSDPETTKDTATDLIQFWNEWLDTESPPVYAQWWRVADAWGHWAVKHEEPLEPCYEWLRDEFFPALDLPDDWILVSDHGFRTDTENGKNGNSSGSRHQHRASGVIATNMDTVRYENMTDFVSEWHTDVSMGVERGNLKALGYLD